MIPLPLATSGRQRAERLAELLRERPETRGGVDAAIDRAFVDAEGVTPNEWRAALEAVPRTAPLDAAALQAWHRALLGGGGFRATEAAPPAAPVEFIASRIASLGAWLAEDSGRELTPPAAGALVLARLVEIRPFEEGSESVARLACRHVMRSRGGLGPVLDAGGLARLPGLVRDAQAFHTRPLVELLEAAAERAVEIALRQL